MPRQRPRLLSGGNPQIAKADGDDAVQAYIAAMPGWKRDVGRRLDEVIVGALPGVCKAVRWNSPLYGVDGQGWFLGVHVFTRYVKVAFFRGASLRPMPPGESKRGDTRYLDIHEHDRFDAVQLADWVTQASRLPGERMATTKKTGVTKKAKSSPKAGAGDWRREMLARIRAIIRQADPDIVEETKWRKPSNPDGVPVWSHDGMICTGETYKAAVKMTFARGAALPDPSGLFNSSLDGNTRRAIDFHEGDEIDEQALKALVRAAVALNRRG